MTAVVGAAPTMGTMLNVAAYHFTSLSDPAGLAAGLRLAATDAAL